MTGTSATKASKAVRATPALVERGGYQHPASSVPQLIAGASFIIPASRGAWWASGLPVRSVESGRIVLHVRFRSRIDDGLLHNDQREHAAKLLSPQEGVPPLVRTFLQPKHNERRDRAGFAGESHRSRPGGRGLLPTAKGREHAGRLFLLLGGLLWR